MFLPVVLALSILAGVIYMAVSKKSSFKLRIVSLGALGLMVLTVIVCSILYAKKAATAQPFILPDASPSDIPPPETGNNLLMTVFFIIFLIALFVMVFISAMREQKRANNKEEEPVNDW